MDAQPVERRHVALQDRPELGRGQLVAGAELLGVERETARPAPGVEVVVDGPLEGIRAHDGRASPAPGPDGVDRPLLTRLIRAVRPAVSSLFYSDRSPRPGQKSREEDAMRRWMGFRAVIVLLLAGGLGVWPVVAAAQSIKVGAVVPLTGRYAALGAQVRPGYEIAIEDINKGGGVTVAGKKMPIELVLLDDESDATKTVARMETLAAQGVVAYLGGAGSDLHAAAASVAEK